MSTEIAPLESSSALGPVCTDLPLTKSESDFCSDTESNSDADIDSDNYSDTESNSEADIDPDNYSKDYGDDDNESDIARRYSPDGSWTEWGTDSVLL